MDDQNPPVLQKPSDATLKQIDFVIQGLEDGKYKEIAKAVEFHQKLKGDDEPTYFTSLLKVIEMQQNRIQNLEIDIGAAQSKEINLGNRLDELENMLNDYKQSMRGVANAILTLANPDPFDQNFTNVPHKHDGEMFINTWKAKF